MGINHQSALGRAVAANDFDTALKSAEKLAAYQPLEASQHVRVGAIAYLAGKTARAMTAFARAKQLSLPEQFKTAWDQATRNPAYKRLLDDTAFVGKIFAGSTAPK